MTADGVRRPVRPEELARRLAMLALEKKAEEILILDLTDLSAACDSFVVCSGGSEQQVLAIADHLDEKMRQDGQPPWHIEGRSHRRWILLDFVDVVVHVFHKETREYYMLERLWGDAEVTVVADPAQPRGVEG